MPESFQDARGNNGLDSCMITTEFAVRYLERGAWHSRAKRQNAFKGGAKISSLFSELTCKSVSGAFATSSAPPASASWHSFAASSVRSRYASSIEALSTRRQCACDRQSTRHFMELPRKLLLRVVIVPTRETGGLRKHHQPASLRRTMEC